MSSILKSSSVQHKTNHIKFPQSHYQHYTNKSIELHLALKNAAGISKTLQYQPHLIRSILLCFVGIYSPFSHELKVEQSTVAEGLGGSKSSYSVLYPQKNIYLVLYESCIRELGLLSSFTLPECNSHLSLFSISVNTAIRVHTLFGRDWFRQYL